MMKQALKRKLIKSRNTLNHALQRILDINRRRKKLSTTPQWKHQEQEFSEELRLLNKIAEQQAHLIKHYEGRLTERV
jgi:hypothetical protein